MQNITKALLGTALLLFGVSEALAQTDVLAINDGLRGAEDGGSVTITLTNAVPVAGMQLTLIDEPDLLEMTDLRVTGRAGGSFDVAAFHSPGDGTEKLLVLCTDPASALVPGDGTVIEIDFTLDPGAPPGRIRLRVSGLILVDANGQLIPAVVQEGTIFDPQVTVFREVGKAAGFEELFALPGQGAFASAWADYDLDGDDDLFYAGGFNMYTTLFRNNGDGTFTEFGESSRIATVAQGAEAAAWGDYDNDGDPDLLMLHLGSAVLLMENNEHDTFTDRTAAAGLASLNETGSSISWVDFNSDGLLDIHIGNGFLFQNNGDKTFRDVALETGIGGVTGTAWADYDNDGDLDVLNDEGQYRNDGGVFTNVTGSTGLICCAGGRSFWGDYDNDGDLDLYMTGASDFGGNGVSVFYQNNGDGTFSDITAAAGLDVSESRTAAWADFDNDADLDLFVSRPSTIDAPYLLFRNNNDGTFEDIALPADVVRGEWFPVHPAAEQGRSAAWSDYNGDGRLDLFVANMVPPDYLFKNLGNGEDNHFLYLKLIGTGSNRSGIGARVTVETGGLAQIREVEGGGNASQNSLPVEFGLGRAEQVDRIIVRWPSGLVEAKTDPTPADQMLTIVEGTLTPTGVRSETRTELPQQVRLFQNYPNPFRTATHIRYDLPRQSRVTIRVYDVLCRHVATLLDEDRSAGFHHLQWDGQLRDGRQASSGLYFVRMSTDDTVQSLSLVRVK